MGYGETKKFKFFTISALASEQDEERLNQFCSLHRVVSVKQQWAAQGNESFWSVCISYIEGREEIVSKSLKNNANRGRIDYKEVLSEQDFVIYAELRNLRKSIAESEGIPVYAIFTNEHLAEMVTQKVITLDSLASIAGIGQARMDKYGVRFIAELNRLFNSTVTTTDETLPNSNS